MCYEDHLFFYPKYHIIKVIIIEIYSETGCLVPCPGKEQRSTTQGAVENAFGPGCNQVVLVNLSSR